MGGGVGSDSRALGDAPRIAAWHRVLSSSRFASETRLPANGFALASSRAPRDQGALFRMGGYRAAGNPRREYEHALLYAAQARCVVRHRQPRPVKIARWKPIRRVIVAGVAS